MIDFIVNVYNSFNAWLESAGLLGGIICSILIIFESVCPILPLFVFMTINMVVFGIIPGFLISYACNVFGCMICYTLSRKFLSNNKLVKKFKSKSFINKTIDMFKHIKFESLVTLIAMPFTPSFFINSFSGISKMNPKKYITALLIAKVFVLIFWAFIGISFIECIKNHIILYI